MKNNSLIRILEDLLNCSELTLMPDNTAWMNYWRMKSYEVDMMIFNSLYYNNIIEADSGNFETGETHYIINISNRTHYKLKNINIIIEDYKYRQTSYQTDFQIELLDALNAIKTKEERKYKLKKLNAKSNIENI